MLPFQSPQASQIGVDLPAKFSWIELEVVVLKAQLVFGDHIRRSHDSLMRCLGLIIVFANFAALAFFMGQLQDRLEEINIQSQVCIDCLKQCQGIS